MRKLLALLAILIIFPKMSTYAAEPELQMMRATAYIGPTGTTCSGKPVYRGIAGANKRHVGQTAIVYQRLPNNKIGKIIGIYEVEDTGDTQGINNDNVIDIWCPDLDECQEFMNKVYENGCQGKVFVQWVEAKG